MAHVHVANKHHENAYIFIAKTTGWEIVDIVADVAQLLVGAKELKTAIKGITSLPTVIRTVEEYLVYVKAAVKVIHKAGSFSSSAKKAAEELINAFKKHSIEIKWHDFKDVKSTRGWDWINPSALAGALGAKTFHMTIMSDSGNSVVEFNTNHDHSWVITDAGVVRAKYGHIWVEDKSIGNHRWEGNSELSKTTQSKQHVGFSWKLFNNTSHFGDVHYSYDAALQNLKSEVPKGRFIHGKGYLLEIKGPTDGPMPPVSAHGYPIADSDGKTTFIFSVRFNGYGQDKVAKYNVPVENLDGASLVLRVANNNIYELIVENTNQWGESRKREFYKV